MAAEWAARQQERGAAAAGRTKLLLYCYKTQETPGAPEDTRGDQGLRGMPMGPGGTRGIQETPAGPEVGAYSGGTERETTSTGGNNGGGRRGP